MKDIRPESVEVAMYVVEETLVRGVQPPRMVLDLLRAAAAAGQGTIAGLPRTVTAPGRFEQFAEQRDEVLAMEPVRVPQWNPSRLARHLLERLLDGIAACHQLYDTYAL